MTLYISKEQNDKRWKGLGQVLGQDGQQFLAKYGSCDIRVHPGTLWLTWSTISETKTKKKQVETNETKEVEHKQSRSNNVLPNNEDSEDESEPEQQHEVSNIQDADTLSTSLERLSFSYTRLPSLENDQVLMKNDNICFNLQDSNEWKTATSISRSGKATRKSYTEEVLCSKIYLTELENQRKLKLQNWKTGRNKRFLERKKT